MDRLTVGIWQPRAGQGPATRLAESERAIAAAVARGADLVVFPELWLSGYGAGEAMAALAEPRDGPFAGAMADLARRHGVAVVYGFPERDGGAVFNSALTMGRDGAPLACHRKTALPSNYEKKLFEIGDCATIFELGSWRAGLVICYEVEFPESVRHAALRGADLVVAPTALGAAWPIVAERVIPVRAFENGVFLAYADWAGAEPGHAYHGGSRIVGPDGHPRATALRREDLIVARLDRAEIARARARIPYLDDRDGLPR